MSNQHTVPSSSLIGTQIEAPLLVRGTPVITIYEIAAVHHITTTAAAKRVQRALYPLALALRFPCALDLETGEPFTDWIAGQEKQAGRALLNAIKARVGITDLGYVFVCDHWHIRTCCTSVIDHLIATDHACIKELTQ